MPRSIVKTLEDVKLLDTNIRSENDEVIFDCNHVMIKKVNKIGKQVAVEVKNHINEKEAKEPNFKITDLKPIGKKPVSPKEFN